VLVFDWEAIGAKPGRHRVDHGMGMHRCELVRLPHGG